MTFYIIFAFICSTLLVISYFAKGHEDVFAVSFSLLLLMISALRYDVGFDYPAYYELAAKEGDFIWSFARLEPLSQIMIFIVWVIGKPFLIFYLYSSLTILFIYKAFKRLIPESMVFGLFIYALFPLFFIDSFSLIRQHLAVALCFFALDYLFKKKYFMYVLIIIVSSLIHAAAFVCLLAIFVQRIKISTPLFLIGVLVTLALGRQIMLLIFSITNISSAYLNPDAVKGEGGTLIKLVVNGVALLLGVVYWQYRDDIKERIKVYLGIFLTGTILYNIMGSFGHAGIRSFEYFSLALIPLLIKLPIYFQPKRVVTLMICLSLLSFNLAFINLSIKNKKKSPLTPYRTVFSQKNSSDFK